MEKTRILRHEVYEKLGLNQEQKAYLSTAFKNHDDIRFQNVQNLWKESIPKLEKASRAEKKIREYLYKAKRMTPTPKILAQKEALELCLTWLTE